MPYNLSRAAALDVANYLSAYLYDSDQSREVASALFSLANNDEESIVICKPDPLKAVRDLQPGDMIDLEGDSYADPEQNKPEFECEYYLVAKIEVETAECTCVYFEGCSPIGFPPDHMLPIGGHDSEYANEK